ncbi:MAG TPA: hypothetical protein VG164_14045 [Trebonia sp.]|jgi:hypothetical protein|nr:hypothetical protein [Trebonia sp.]
MTETAAPAAPAPDPDEAQRAIEYCYDQGWSDGLPLVPASQPLVDRFLATTGKDPGEIIGALEQVGRDCTVRTAAVNAAMAGCEPEYFPVVLAAFEALMRERAARGGGFQSTSGPAPLLVVNGPVRRDLKFNTAGGAFGPGFRPNMTIPRAIGLIVRNAFGIHPHVLEQATQGVPGRWSVCVAENEEESPWEPLAENGGVAGGVSAVSAMLTRTMEFIDNRHTPDPEDVLRDIADSVGRLGPQIFPHTPVALVLCPEHAQMFASAGMTKADVQRWLIERSGRTAGELRRAGKGGVLGLDAGEDAEAVADEHFHRVLARERDIPVIVAGAKTAAISMVVRIFGEWSGTSVPVGEKK